MYYIKLELDTYPNPASLLNRQSPISCRLTLDWLEFTWAMMHDVLYNVSTIHLPTNTKSLILGVQCSKYQKGFSTFKYTWRRVSHQPLKLMGFFNCLVYLFGMIFVYLSYKATKQPCWIKENRRFWSFVFIGWLDAKCINI